MNKRIKSYLIHLGLLLLTLASTTFTGAYLYSSSVPTTAREFWLGGLEYSIPFLTILLVHEFGHYLVARLHKVPTSLPYVLPFLPPIGTLGAVITMKGTRNSRKSYFDIGIAGPLAGWVVAMGVLAYGYSTLPPAEHIFEIHPEYEQYGAHYADSVYTDAPNDSTLSMYFGTNLTMQFFEATVADPERVPVVQEFMHYPWLVAGFLALVFTSLNLLPIGQLDGGHILYGLIGRRQQRWVSSVVFIGLILFSGTGLTYPSMPLLNQEGDFWLMVTDSFLITVPLYLFYLYLVLRAVPVSPNLRIILALSIVAIQQVSALVSPGIEGFHGWLLFILLIGRFIGVEHPPALEERPLSTGRQVLGWFALFVFVISFSLFPIQ